MDRKLIFLLIWAGFFQSGFAQPVLFHFPANFFDKNQPPYAEYVMICQNEKKLRPLYVQKMEQRLNQMEASTLLVGKVKSQLGQIDSLIWSEGDFELCLTHDSICISNTEAAKAILFRLTTDLSREHEEGELDESQSINGLIRLPNSRGKQPRKIMLDLSTNYVNLDYPADTYPIYRHYEWSDIDLDGMGNAFMLTYSDKTTHEAWIQTKKMGDVKLYDRPFQEIYIRSLDGLIAFELTKAEKVSNLNIDYALRGPWKIIYYIEW